MLALLASVFASLLVWFFLFELQKRSLVPWGHELRIDNYSIPFTCLIVGFPCVRVSGSRFWMPLTILNAAIATMIVFGIFMLLMMNSDI